MGCEWPALGIASETAFWAVFLANYWPRGLLVCWLTAGVGLSLEVSMHETRSCIKTSSQLSELAAAVVTRFQGSLGME